MLTLRETKEKVDKNVVVNLTFVQKVGLKTIKVYYIDDTTGDNDTVVWVVLIVEDTKEGYVSRRSGKVESPPVVHFGESDTGEVLGFSV